MAETVTGNYNLTTLWEVEMGVSPRVEVAAQWQIKRDPASKPMWMAKTDSFVTLWPPHVCNAYTFTHKTAHTHVIHETSVR